MGLTETNQHSPDPSSSSDAQRLDILKRYISKADREKICAAHQISKTTFYRILGSGDLSNEVFGVIVKCASDNAEEAKRRVQETRAILDSLQ